MYGVAISLFDGWVHVYLHYLTLCTDVTRLDPDVVENSAVAVRTMELLFNTHGVSCLPRESRSRKCRGIPLVSAALTLSGIVDQFSLQCASG